MLLAYFDDLLIVHDHKLDKNRQNANIVRFNEIWRVYFLTHNSFILLDLWRLLFWLPLLFLYFLPCCSGANDSFASTAVV
jgi:GT2 family glycosyltransferase